MKKPELLAPVGDYETLASAIKAGADAVYFGIEWINMRASSARNFKLKEITIVMNKLHKNNMKGYLTLNTVIYDHEIKKVERIIIEAKKSKVDAIIATDFAIIQLCNKHHIEVHISTQLSVLNYESVKFFSKFSPRIVLAREATLEQIKEIKKKIKKDNLICNGRQVEIETFIHGALCVAYSGRCFMSQYHNRLSANRGQCLQECRRSYKITDVEDPRREFIVDNNYVMSPKDLCTLPILDELIKVGIDVFKIEGRAKGPEYVYNVTLVYRKAIDLIFNKKFNLKEKSNLLEELEKVFNRGFSTNFYLGVPTNDSWAKFYGSAAKEKKFKVGKITNYYSKINVASCLIEEKINVHKDDEIIIIGSTTGFVKGKLNKIKLENQIIKEAKQGDEISFKVDEKVRKSDILYIVKKRNVSEEEQRYQNLIEKIGIHKPFKTTKNKGMD